MKQLYTRWGKELDCNHVLQEYPRPLLQRADYINLNGYWDYAVTHTFKKPAVYDGKILVPFSPESVLSGVNRQLQPDEYLWYRTFLPVDEDRLKDGFRLILHFGAVDQACRVYVNGREAARHTGGYLPFSADITALCCGRMACPSESHSDRPEPNTEPGCGDNIPLPAATSSAELIVAVRDLSDTSYHAKGKQKLKRGGMFYTAQSGIWQTVWMEYVPEHYMKEIVAEPDLDQASVRITVHSASGLPVTIQVREPALYHFSAPIAAPAAAISNPSSASLNKTGSPRPDLSAPAATASKAEVSKAEPVTDHPVYPDTIIAEYNGQPNHEILVSLPVIRPWTCEEPYLYYFTVTMGEDMAESYFALRSFTVAPDPKGIPRICLNGQAQFQNGVLDQGYWPDGLYTAPSDEALIFDITEMKKMGFNMLRKHIKIEPQRWYYHCDRLGMIVWQDMVNGGSYYKHWFVTYAATLFSRNQWRIPDTCLHLLSRTHKNGRKEFLHEMKETIRILKGHPSIAVWVLFNEGWGQFQTEEITRIARKCDGSRLIDQASGWFDQKGGDLQSIHHYFFKFKFSPENRRATVLSEFGGYSLQIPEHSAYDKLYGYGTYKDIASLKNAYEARMQEVRKQIPAGLCAGIYTQLSDVEEEVNGIMTYDREINKLSDSSVLP